MQYDNPGKIMDQIPWRLYLTEAELASIEGGTLTIKARRRIAREIFRSMHEPLAAELGMTINAFTGRLLSADPFPPEIMARTTPQWLIFQGMKGNDVSAAAREAVPADAPEYVQEREARATSAEKAQRERSRDAAAALGIDIDVIEPMWLNMPDEAQNTAPDDPFAFYAMDDSEWAVIQPFMLPQVGRVIVNWRAICDKLLARFHYGQRDCPWSKLSNSSTVRMAFRRANDAGVWARIGAALPTLDVRREMWANVVHGAEVAAGARRSRCNERSSSN
jgi:transposase